MVHNSCGEIYRNQISNAVEQAGYIVCLVQVYSSCSTQVPEANLYLRSGDAHTAHCLCHSDYLCP